MLIVFFIIYIVSNVFFISYAELNATETILSLLTQLALALFVTEVQLMKNRQRNRH